MCLCVCACVCACRLGAFLLCLLFFCMPQFTISNTPPAPFQMSRLTLTKIYSHKTSLSRLGLGTLMLLRIYICVVRPKSFYLFATIHFSSQLTRCPIPSISSHLISPLIRALEPHICFICHCHLPVLFFVCVWVTRGVRGTLFVCYCTFITASPTSVSLLFLLRLLSVEP